MKKKTPGGVPTVGISKNVEKVRAALVKGHKYAQEESVSSPSYGFCIKI